MKLKIFILMLLIFTGLYAEKTLLILPYCAKNLSDAEANNLLVSTRRIVFETDDYMQALSFETEKLIFEKTEFDNCDYFLHESGSDKFMQIVSSTNVEEILSCAVNFENGEYGLFFKLKNAQTGEIIKSKAFGSNSDFDNLVNNDLKKLLYSFFEIKDNRTKFVSLSVSGGYLDNFSDYSAGCRLGFGSVKFGELALETNLFTENLAENISLTYSTPMKYYLYLKFGVGFTSERKNGFSLTDYYEAPNINDIKEMEHSLSALAGIGLSLPITHNLRVNLSAESDIIYAKWKYWDNSSKESVIYSYYPEIELSYLIRF